MPIRLLKRFAEQRGLTPRSRRGPTAGRQARAGGTRYIFTGPGLASCRWSRLTSNVRPHKATNHFRRAVKKPPPAPPGWNRTIADLIAEMIRGERKSLASPETDWARDYERSLVPPGSRFPRRGDVYEAVSSVEVSFITSWSAPFSGGGKHVLLAGQRLIINEEPSSAKPISVHADAFNPEALEALVVPQSDRESPKYLGFYFYIHTLELLKSFRLVSSSAA